MDRHEHSKELDANDLEDNDNGPDSQECWVSKDSFENVNLVIDLSSTNHVEDLHENKHVEYNGQVT